MTELIPFNINHKVRVKLTTIGRVELQRRHQAIMGQFAYRAPVEDAEGWSEWQLWDLMWRLGHLCYMGGQVPFETNIQIVVEDRPNL